MQIVQRNTQRLSQCLECFDSALALAGFNLAQIGFADSCFGGQHILREAGMLAPGFDGMCTGEQGADNGTVRLNFLSATRFRASNNISPVFVGAGSGVFSRVLL